MAGKFFLDPASGGSAYKFVITGDPEVVGGASATLFVTAPSPPADSLVEAMTDALRGITDVTDVECYRLTPSSDGTLVFEP